MATELVICGRFVLNKKIASGSFGDVYSGYDRATNNLVAIKLQHKTAVSGTNSAMLKHEYEVYQQVTKPDVRIPQSYWYGEQDEYKIMVMEFMGVSTEELFNKCCRRFSLKTTLMIGIQLIGLLQHIHSCCYIHRDLKPENFLIGINDNRHYIYLIDFGLAKRFKMNGVHHVEVSGKKLVGTSRYASINSHLGRELSRRDDLISLGYILIYFIRGSLPWQGLPADTKDARYQAILNKKLDTSVDQLCQDLPEAFNQYMRYVTSLKFKERPMYSYLRNLFLTLMREQGYSMDGQYDWVKFL